MESKHTGADKDAEYKLRLAEKEAKFDAIRKWITDNNIQPVTPDEFFRIAMAIAASNRKAKEDENRNADDSQTPSDNAA